MQIVILAGGLATRLNKLAIDSPKSMILVNGKPFMEHQILLLKKNGIKEFIVCIGHLGEKIIEYFGNGDALGVKIIYSSDGNTLLGTGGAIKKAEELLNKYFFVIYGDSFLSVPFKKVYEKLVASKKQGLMVLYKNNNLYDKSNIVLIDDRVVKYDKYNYSKEMKWIDAGITLFNKAVLTDIPLNTIYPLEEIIIKLVENNQLNSWVTNERFYEIGSIEGLNEFKASKHANDSI